MGSNWARQLHPLLFFCAGPAETVSEGGSSKNTTKEKYEVTAVTQIPLGARRQPERA